MILKRENGRFIVQPEPGDNLDKIEQYLEALQWLINGQKQQVKESFQDRIYRG